MPKTSDDRSVMLLEALAAGAILSIVGIVLFMVFSYRPA
jgi:hypothetical protein